VAQFETNSTIKFNLKTKIMIAYAKQIVNHNLHKLELAAIKLLKNTKNDETGGEKKSNLIIIKYLHL
jgi:hypothetical protein